MTMKAGIEDCPTLHKPSSGLTSPRLGFVTDDPMNPYHADAATVLERNGATDRPITGANERLKHPHMVPSDASLALSLLIAGLSLLWSASLSSLDPSCPDPFPTHPFSSPSCLRR